MDAAVGGGERRGSRVDRNTNVLTYCVPHFCFILLPDFWSSCHVGDRRRAVKQSDSLPNFPAAFELRICIKHCEQVGGLLVILTRRAALHVFKLQVNHESLAGIRMSNQTTGEHPVSSRCWRVIW